LCKVGYLVENVFNSSVNRFEQLPADITSESNVMKIRLLALALIYSGNDECSKLSNSG